MHSAFTLAACFLLALGSLPHAIAVFDMTKNNNVRSSFRGLANMSLTIFPLQLAVYARSI